MVVFLAHILRAQPRAEPGAEPGRGIIYQATYETCNSGVTDKSKNTFVNSSKKGLCDRSVNGAYKGSSKSGLGVNVEKNFEPEYIVPVKAKKLFLI